LRQTVCAHRRRLAGRLDLRWLDFATDTAPVVEADGRVLLEGPREARDTLLAIIPAPPAAPGPADYHRAQIRVLRPVGVGPS
jgi:hypothetical protein